MKRLLFEDFITLQRGFDLPKSEMKDGSIPVLGSNGVIGFHNQPKVNGPGVVTGRSGSLGFVQFIDRPFWPHNTSLWVKDFKNNHPRFVYYKLMTLDLGKFNGGASVPTLNRNSLKNILILVPPLKTQSKIANLLSFYDDLIENNRRRIQLLEQAARLIYEEWFIRFRFPGYEQTKIIDGLPKGWDRKQLGEITTLKYGKALKAEDRSEGKIPVYGSSGIVGYHNQAIIKGPSIIVGRKGNVGSIYWTQSDCYPIDTVYYIDSAHSNRYLYYSLKNLVFHSSDSAVPGLNRDYAHRQSLICPPLSLINRYEEITKDLFDQILHLQTYNQKLIEARDLLLPRLMSGEIVV